jgi:N-acetylneuraminate synthase/N,N'-diacetyllegionaminate synthase
MDLQPDTMSAGIARATSAFEFAGRRIGPGAPVFVIAEVGINHDGGIGKAERLIDAAAEARADAVKFQTYVTESFVAPANPLHGVFKANELSAPEHLRRLKRRAEQRGILFFSSATDFIGLQRLEALGVPLYKLSSANLTNLPLLRQVAATGKPVIYSSGGATLAEVAIAYETLKEAGAAGIAVLKCTSLYPCPPQNANLLGIKTLQAALPIPVGYSDHTEGIAAVTGAVALGATIIEKHFTLSKADEGHDHYFSADPAELAAMVAAVRAMEKMLGSRVLGPVGEEDTFRRQARRVVTAQVDIAPGTVIGADMVGLRRPENDGGLAPDLMPHVIGRRAKNAIRAGSSIRWDDI